MAKNPWAQAAARAKWDKLPEGSRERTQATAPARAARARQRIALPSLPPAPAPADVLATADAQLTTDSLTTAERAARRAAGILDDPSDPLCLEPRLG